MKAVREQNGAGLALEIAICSVISAPVAALNGGSLAAATGGRSRIAVAPCFFQVERSAEAGRVYEIQATPAGRFKPRDGRKMTVEAWALDAALARSLIATFRAEKTPLVIDYEHQTLAAESNGQPAPAAGWIRDVEWREGSGLWLKVELTERAQQYVAAGEYRYFSPVFAYDKTTGAVQRLLMGALTNNPALDGMAPLALAAAASGTRNVNASLQLTDIERAVCHATGTDATEFLAAKAEALDAVFQPAASDVADLCARMGITPEQFAAAKCQSPADAHGLDQEELAICHRTGIAPHAFAATKATPR